MLGLAKSLRNGYLAASDNTVTNYLKTKTMLRKPLLLFAVLLTFGISTFAQEKKQRIITSYILAYGMAAQQREIDYWMSQGDYTVGQLVESHRAYLASNATYHTFAVQKAYLDVFGRFPDQGEQAYWMGTRHTYTEMVQKHVEFLAARPSEYEKVIIASYKQAFKRSPDARELSYWKGQPTRSYLNLLIKHDEYMAQNPQAFPKRKPVVTASNSNMVSQKVFKEALAVQGTKALTAAGATIISRDAAGVISTGGGNVISTGGGNVISTGGGNVISTGGGN